MIKPGRLNRMVDAAMAATVNVHPKMPREICQQIITAALNERGETLLHPEWTTEPPNKPDMYWNWNGDPECAPHIFSVLMSGHGPGERCFIDTGNSGIDTAIWCDEYGGYWLPVATPVRPDHCEPLQIAARH